MEVLISSNNSISLEPIIDDEEGLTSLCIRWNGDDRGYICLAREIDSNEIYIEYLSQEHGFYTKKAHYQLNKEYLEISLTGEASFSKNANINKILIPIQDSYKNLQTCLNVLFEDS